MTDRARDFRLGDKAPHAVTPTRWSLIADLFDRAAERPVSERADFLDAHTVGSDGRPDLALREEVERLLAADAPDGYLGGSLAPETVLAPPPEAGPWRLTERLGQGGMGEVWRAERAGAEFEQAAAVKLVRPGLGESVRDRFRAERRILAGLDHPAIARLLGGGTASDGRPYLAAELVDGQPVTTYADARRLGVNDRLALFTEVCAAVAYAHARLVVHRDLKPSNVLVTPEGRVKLLDFGIAKLLDDEDGLHTRTGHPILTPAYAAPEQSASGAVTTATDVYGLGVLLHELLTGTRPTPGGGATRPSDAVTTTGETGGRVPPDPARPAPGDEAESLDTGALRSTTADRLRRRLRGDLDRIVLKALRADPERRYRGAAELGADVQRHLDGLPVEARPESVSYRMGKFVRRNRALVAAASVALVAVVGGATVSLIQSQRVIHEQQVSEAVSDYMLDLFRSADEETEAGEMLSVFDAVRRGAARVDESLAGQPEVRAQVYGVIAEVYRGLRRFEEADSMAAESVALWESMGAGRSALAARSRATWGDVLSELRRYPESEAALRQALADHLALGPPSRDEVADAQAWLAEALVHQDRFEEAIPLYRQALATRRALHGPRSAAAGAALDDLGFAIKRSGDPETGRMLYLQALAIRRAALGDVHVDVANTLQNLGALERQVGNFDQSAAYYAEQYSIYSSIYGVQSPVSLRTARRLAARYNDSDQPERTVELLRPTLQSLVAERGPDDHLVGRLQRTLGIAYMMLDQYEPSERLLRQSLWAFRRPTPDDAAQRLLGHRWMMNLAVRRGDLEAAAQSARAFMREGAALPGDVMLNSRVQVAAVADSLGWRLEKR